MNVYLVKCPVAGASRHSRGTECGSEREGCWCAVGVGRLEQWVLKSWSFLLLIHGVRVLPKSRCACINRWIFFLGGGVGLSWGMG